MEPMAYTAASHRFVGMALLAALGGCSDDGAEEPLSTTSTDTGGSGIAGQGGGAAGHGGVGGGAGGAGGSGAQPLDLVYYDVNHVLATGQSLSVGATGVPPLSTAQPYDNRMFVGGVASVTNLTSFVPLTEGVDPAVETMSSAFANLVTELGRDETLLYQPAGEQTHDLLVTLHGIGGTAYVGLKKGTVAYDNGMAQLVAGEAVSAQLSLSHVVRAVTTVHGESDHIAGNLSYENDLIEWQQDYEDDVQALTGQSEPVPLLQTQMSSWTRYGQAQSVIPTAQLAASRNNPDDVILVGPKYAVAYSTDGVHLTSDGYRHMGELYANVYRRVVLEGRRWLPLQPRDVWRSGAVITVVFDVPVPPLVLDTTLVTNPGDYGFEFYDDSGSPPAIQTVMLVSDDRVVITLTSTPTGGDRRLRYAHTGTPGALAGATTGPRGNLRDSDDTPSRHFYPLYNWCVHFDEPVP